jgi:hypothetical protein
VAQQEERQHAGRQERHPARGGGSERGRRVAAAQALRQLVHELLDALGELELLRCLAEALRPLDLARRCRRRPLQPLGLVLHVVHHAVGDHAHDQQRPEHHDQQRQQPRQAPVEAAHHGMEEARHHRRRDHPAEHPGRRGDHAQQRERQRQQRHRCDHRPGAEPQPLTPLRRSSPAREIGHGGG